MLKVLIVDDEFLVRVGLESTIPWGEYGFHVVGSARNGKEAIQLFEEHDPDVLLTDIKMPLMGGLELIETLKKIKPLLVAIIITHYDDFNYAQEALKLGANDYVLKSELSPENLIKTISKHIRNDSYKKEVPSDQRDSLFHDFCSEGDFLQIQKNCEKFLTDKSFTALIIKLYRRTENDERADSFDLIKAFDNIASNVPHTDFSKKTFYNMHREVLYVCSYQNEASGNISEQLSDYINLLKENSRLYLDIDIFVGVSSVYASTQDLHKAITEATHSLELSFFEPSGITLYTHTPIKLYTPCPKVNSSFLKQSIINGDLDNINNQIQKIMDQLETTKNIHYTKRIYLELLNLANEMAEEMKYNVRFNFEFQDFSGFESMKEYIISIYNQLCQMKNVSYSFIISKCIKFIEENYMNNISLSDLADYTHKSKSYLSTLFKLETNVNFSIFLINYRIEKAKQLLRESDCKIYEIAERVGFNNPYYFSKVFKETTGLCCKTYRDIHYQVGANYNG